MDRYAVKTEHKRKTVAPKYVHLVCGIGKYTNLKAAETLAKRNAGIDELYTNEVFNINNTPFEVLNKEEFLEKIKPGNKIYLYGSQDSVENESGSFCGAVSAITNDTWGSLTYSIRKSSNVDKAILANTRHLVFEYESKAHETAPPPVVVSNKISVQEPICYSIIVAALILEE